MKNYPFCARFTPSDIFYAIGSMLEKIADLIEQEVDIFDVLDAYASYLELMAFFLRATLQVYRQKDAEDFSCQLSTVDIFAILTECFDMNCYVKNGSIYMFPDFHLFINQQSSE